MWVERIVGTPHTWGFAVYPVAHGELGHLHEPQAKAGAGSYPVEREFPDVEGRAEDVVALWLGNAFEVQALVLGVTADLPGVCWPPLGSSPTQTMHVRGIGRIWVGLQSEAVDAIEMWAERARDRLCSGAVLDPKDEHMIRRLLREIEKEKTMGMPDQDSSAETKTQEPAPAEKPAEAAGDEASTAMDTDNMHEPVLPGVPPGKF